MRCEASASVDFAGGRIPRVKNRAQKCGRTIGTALNMCGDPFVEAWRG
jgi:hypothetical protein